MADQSGKGADISPHPFFNRVAEQDAAEAVTIMGYLGPSPGSGSVVLYASLDNLADSVEIPAGDVLHVEDVPETTMPFGAKLVWVRSKARITRRRVASAEDAGSPQKQRHVIEVRKGRLRMLSRQQVRSPEDCSTCVSVCISICRGCKTCTSECTTTKPE